MRPVDRKSLRPSSGVRVRLQGYPGKPRGRGLPARSLVVVALIVTAVGVAAVFHHLPRGAGEKKPAPAPAGRAGIFKPAQRVSAPSSVPRPAVSPELLVRAKSASKVAPGPSVNDSSVPHSGGRRYHVRVGEFADKVPAEELATRLRALGYAARIVGTQPFLVLVGGYLDEPTASRLVSHLRGQGFDAVMNLANAPQ